MEQCQEPFCRQMVKKTIKYRVGAWMVILLCKACVDLRMRHKLGLPA